MKTHRFIGLIAIALTTLLSAGALSPERLETDVRWLSDSLRDGRASASQGARATADYVFERFRSIGLDTEFQDIDANRRNVIGRSGTASRHIVIGAHYDGQGRGFASASDNAAGVAVMLEIARELSAVDLGVSLLFIAFDDEERGLFGSRHYVANPILPLDDALAVIVMDTMGRSFIDLERWTLIVLGTEFTPELGEIVSLHGGSELVFLGTDLVGPRSDFAPFAAARVPYLFFSNATHADYHGRGDTPDRLRYDRLDTDGETIGRVIADIAALDARPGYMETPVFPDGEARGLVSLMETIENERSDLSGAYAVLFDDLRDRLSPTPSRADLRLATSVLLAIATPSVSSFSLSSLIGPFYEAEGKSDEAVAAYREALRWTSNPFARSTLEEKIQSLD